MLTDNMKKTSLEYHGEWDYINPCKQKTYRQYRVEGKKVNQ